MALSYSDLGGNLPPGSIEFVGNNQVKLNFSQLTGEEIDLNSPMLDGIAQLLDRLVELTNAINNDRALADPPLPPIVFASKTLVGTLSDPIFRITVDLRVNGASFMENLIDPLESINS